MFVGFSGVQYCVSKSSFNVRRTFKCKMTSVDSGVETGNDSNDSSIVQHESLTSGQISSNVSTAVATTGSGQSEINENEPVIESYKCTGNNESSTSTSSAGPVVICSPKVLEFTIPLMYSSDELSPTMELVRKGPSYYRKMKTLRASRRNHHYVTWFDVQGPLIERKMRLAAATNNTIMMRRLLNIGISPNNHDERGRTPLHLASCRGYTEMVRLLLEHGADPNLRDCIGNTPLHLAAVTSKISVVTLLLKAGTDVLSLDQHGYNPLQLAQTMLRMLQNCKGEDMLRVKEEVHNVVSMLLAYLQKQKDAREKVETLSTFCSRLSLSSTSDQVQDDVKDLLANLDALTITS